MSNTSRRPTTRVLVIDDDPLIRSLLVSALRKECLVAVASDGLEGFSKAQELTPDVAVIDINMPGWDGLKTLEAFRTHSALRDVKIIMLTADSSKQTVVAAIQGGADDYLIKTTFSKTEFYKKLNRLLPGTIAEKPASAPEPAAPIAPASAEDPFANSAPADAEQTASARTNSRNHSIADIAAAAANTRPTDSLQAMIDGWE